MFNDFAVRLTSRRSVHASRSLNAFGRIWASLGEFGRIWAGLGEVGRGWTRLDTYGESTVLLDDKYRQACDMNAAHTSLCHIDNDLENLSRTELVGSLVGSVEQGAQQCGSDNWDYEYIHPLSI